MKPTTAEDIEFCIGAAILRVDRAAQLPPAFMGAVLWAQFADALGYDQIAQQQADKLMAWLATPSATADSGRITLPASERGRSDAEIKRIAALQAKLLRADLKKDKREKTEQELDNLLAAPRIAAQAAWEKSAAMETADLAKARGEDVERSKSGTMTIRSRDPLMSLLRCGHLTAEQFDVGVAVRTLYERRDAGLGSQMGGIGGVTSPTYDNSAAVFNGLQRAKALQKVGLIERAVALKCEPNALAMLRVVCGQGLTLSSQGKSALQRNAASLAAALDVVADMAGGR